jgi:hypothetical protein
MTKLEDLDLTGTSVTDDAVRYLKGLGHLKTLRLYATKVTDLGVNSLHAALPNCMIEWNPPATGKQKHPRSAE